MRAPLLRVPAALALLFTAGCGPAVEPADLVLLNGRIVTVDEGRPEAQALAVRRDTIVAIGSNREIARYAREPFPVRHGINIYPFGRRTEVVNLEGRLAIL